MDNWNKNFEIYRWRLDVWRYLQMAKTAKIKKEIPMEEALWKSADKLRGSVEPSEYKHVVLSLFFLKFASDKFKECRILQKEKVRENSTLQNAS